GGKFPGRVGAELENRVCRRDFSAAKSRRWCPGGRASPIRALLQLTLRGPLEWFVAELEGYSSEEISRQTVGPPGPVSGIHELDSVANQSLQGRGGFGVQRFQRLVQLCCYRGHADNLSPEVPIGNPDFLAAGCATGLFNPF